jgi:hypothetical protein
VSRLVGVARAIWSFAIGDDWMTAIGVVGSLGLTALLAGSGASAWWVMPPAVVVLLALSLLRASR